MIHMCQRGLILQAQVRERIQKVFIKTTLLLSFYKFFLTDMMLHETWFILQTFVFQRNEPIRIFSENSNIESESFIFLRCHHNMNSLIFA
jgi:hypothetical protein